MIFKNKKFKTAMATLAILTIFGGTVSSAYAAELNGADAICFTAGIGENSPVIRELICSPYLEHLGVELDKEANNIRGKERIVSTPSAKTKVLVIPTNEELEIARHTLAIVKGK
jgi:acetate kinase